MGAERKRRCENCSNGMEPNMCMCGALRRVAICFGWSGVEENRERGCEEENAGIRDNVETRKAQRCVKDWRVHGGGIGGGRGREGCCLPRLRREVLGERCGRG